MVQAVGSAAADCVNSRREEERLDESWDRLGSLRTKGPDTMGSLFQRGSDFASRVELREEDSDEELATGFPLICRSADSGDCGSKYVSQRGNVVKKQAETNCSRTESRVCTFAKRKEPVRWIMEEQCLKTWKGRASTEHEGRLRPQD